MRLDPLSVRRPPGAPRPGASARAAIAAALAVAAACAEPGAGVGPGTPAPADADRGSGAPPAPASPRAAKDGPSCDAPDGDCAMPPEVPRDPEARNVLDAPLATCSTEPLTGWRRSGRCETGPRDRGVHVVCARVTDAFLAFSRERGNDLVTPRPEYRFPGLEAGDRWCLCAARWLEALDSDVAPPVVLDATEDTALRYVSLDALRRHATTPGDVF